LNNKKILYLRLFLILSAQGTRALQANTWMEDIIVMLGNEAAEQCVKLWLVITLLGRETN
jgi:hypothetical protein